MNGQAKHAGAVEGRTPVFIVSTGRCGSTLLTNMIRLNPQILSLSEFFGLLLTGPFPEGVLSGAEYWSLLSTPHTFVASAYRVGAPIEEFLYEVQPNSRFTAATGIPPIMVTSLPHLTDDPEALYDEVEKFVLALDPAPVADQHRQLFEWLADRAGARVWVERSGYSLRHVPELIRLFPGARFVHLYRDGRESAYSMSRSGAFRLGAVYMKLIEALGMNPFDEPVPDNVTVPPELVPLMPDTFDVEAFRAVDLPVADFGKAWAEQIVTGLESLRAVPPDRLFQFGYRRLTEDTGALLTELAEFIGPVDASAQWIEAASALVSHRPSGWLKLPASEREQLEEVTRAAMALLPAE